MFNIKKVKDKIIFVDNMIKKFNKSYISYHLRPKNIDSICINPIILKNYRKNNKLAIIIQGPYINNNSRFTEKTIELYKKIFPSCKIILSIWEDDNCNLKEDSDLVIIKNKKEKLKNGYMNNNYQVISTYNAIVKAEELGCSYVLKTRTDIRLYAENIKEYLFSLLEQFPIDNNDGKNQLERIVVLNIFTLKYVPYHISDIIQFGNIKDLKTYWNEIDERPKEKYSYLNSKDEIYKTYTIKERFKYTGSENYFAIKYLNKIGLNVENTLACYYSILANRFIVIDSSCLNLIWDKYSRDEYKIFNYTDSERTIGKEAFSYKDWFILYKNSEHILINENILTKKNFDSVL